MSNPQKHEIVSVELVNLIRVETTVGHGRIDPDGKCDDPVRVVVAFYRPDGSFVAWRDEWAEARAGQKRWV